MKFLSKVPYVLLVSSLGGIALGMSPFNVDSALVLQDASVARTLKGFTNECDPASRATSRNGSHTFNRGELVVIDRSNGSKSWGLVVGRGGDLYTIQVISPETPVGKYISKSFPAGSIDKLNQPLRIISCGTHQIQGRRDYQEDRYNIGRIGDDRFYFAGLFDGHGGKEVAEYVNSTLRPLLGAQLGFAGADVGRKGAVEEVFRNAYRTVDGMIRELKMEAGSTAVTALVINNRLYVANVGDSEAFFFPHEGGLVEMTTSHKPRASKMRIEAAGGAVVSYGVPRATTREGGPMLAVSRALGDHALKQSYPPIVSSEPAVHSIELKPGFLIMASDGMWDTISKEEAEDIIKQALREGKSSQAVAELLVNRAFEKGSTDNISVVASYIA